MKKKILVRAPVLSRSGYGEQARFAIRCLRAYEDKFDIYVQNINWGQTGWIYEDSEERRWIDKLIAKNIQYQDQGASYDMSLQVTIPNEWEKIAPINIGYTAGIETTKVAPKWIEKCYSMDRIIVVSNHAKNVFESTQYNATNSQTNEDFIAKCEAPITVVNYPVRNYETKKIDLELETDFNFLTVAQWGVRKNIEKTVLWFVEEFIDQDVGLVVKLNLRNNSTIDKHNTKNKLYEIANKYPNRKCKIYLVHGTMTDEELSGLYSHPKIKALICLSHGEGFGLPMFEAAYNGLPVVAPAWSGHCDFLVAPVKDKKGKIKDKALFAKVEYDIQPVQKQAIWDGVIQEDSSWCYPRQGSYKMKLREVYKDYGRYKSIAKKLKNYVITNFTEEKQYKQFAEAVLGEEIVNIDLKDLPKISIITSVYNGDEFIRPFLEDVTQQSIFKEKCELVLVNADSPGDEEEVIQEYIEKYPNNIVYKKLDKDPGIYATWNTAIEMSSGEYITNANLDDRKHIKALEYHAKELFANSEVDLVYADSWITDKPNETFEANSSNNRKYTFPLFSFENLKMVNMPHQCPMWRRTIHEKHGYFDQKYRSAGDWDLWLKSAAKGVKFKKINSILGLYYFNPEGISTNPENFDWKREEEKEVYEKYKDVAVKE